MQRTLIGLTVLTFLAMGFVVAAQPKAPAKKCTWTGTEQRDVKTGNDKPNTLCSRGGGDFVHGGAGNDLVKVGRGRDVGVGAQGRDVLQGGGGKDRLFAVDGRGGETIKGGPGIDQCFVDPGDQVVGCERVFRGLSQQEVNALEHVAFQVMTIVELEVPSVTPTPTLPPPVVTVTQTNTVTVTKTAPFPPCSPPPDNPPAPC